MGGSLHVWCRKLLHRRLTYLSNLEPCGNGGPKYEFTRHLNLLCTWLSVYTHDVRISVYIMHHAYNLLRHITLHRHWHVINSRKIVLYKLCFHIVIEFCVTFILFHAKRNLTNKSICASKVNICKSSIFRFKDSKVLIQTTNFMTNVYLQDTPKNLCSLSALFFSLSILLKLWTLDLSLLLTVGRTSSQVQCVFWNRTDNTKYLQGT